MDLSLVERQSISTALHCIHNHYHYVERRKNHTLTKTISVGIIIPELFRRHVTSSLNLLRTINFIIIIRFCLSLIKINSHIRPYTTIIIILFFLLNNRFGHSETPTGS